MALKIPLRLWAALREAVHEPLDTLEVEGADLEDLALTTHASMPSAACAINGSTLQETVEPVDLQPAHLTQLAGTI